MIEQYHDIFLKLANSLIDGNKNLSIEETQSFLQNWFRIQSPSVQYCWQFITNEKNIRDLDEWLQKIHPLEEIDSFIFSTHTSNFILASESSIIVINNKIYFVNKAYKQCKGVEGFILTSQKMQFILDYLHLCLEQKKIIPLITVKQIWLNVQKILEMFWGQDVTRLFAKKCRIFHPMQAADLVMGQLSLLFRKRFWFELSFDMILWVNGNKYLFEGLGLTDEDKDIYYAWKKQIISEDEYCGYVDLQVRKGIKQKFPSKESKLQILNLDIIDPIKFHHYQTFKKADEFILIPEEVVEEIFHNGQIREIQQNEIVYKSGTNFLYFYVVIEGLFQAGENQLSPSSAFGFESFVRQEKKVNTTLKCSSEKGNVFTIRLDVLRFILNNYWHTLIQCVKNASQFTNLSFFWGALLVDGKKAEKKLKKKNLKFKDGNTVQITEQLWNKIALESIQLIYV